MAVDGQVQYCPHRVQNILQYQQQPQQQVSQFYPDGVASQVGGYAASVSGYAGSVTSGASRVTYKPDPTTVTSNLTLQLGTGARALGRRLKRGGSKKPKFVYRTYMVPGGVARKKVYLGESEPMLPGDEWCDEDYY